MRRRRTAGPQVQGGPDFEAAAGAGSSFLTGEPGRGRAAPAAGPDRGATGVALAGGRPRRGGGGSRTQRSGPAGCRAGRVGWGDSRVRVRQETSVPHRGRARGSRARRPTADRVSDTSTHGCRSRGRSAPRGRQAPPGFRGTQIGGGFCPAEKVGQRRPGPPQPAECHTCFLTGPKPRGFTSPSDRRSPSAPPRSGRPPASSRAGRAPPGIGRPSPASPGASPSTRRRAACPARE